MEEVDWNAASDDHHVAFHITLRVHDHSRPYMGKCIQNQDARRRPVDHCTQLSSLVIGSCLACTDPVLSQVTARGAFAKNYIPLHLREDLSSEAGANDSFAFPSLMLATFLIRHAAVPGSGKANSDGEVIEHVETVGRIGGGVGVALKMWFLETWLYTVLLSVVYGALVGYASCLLLKLALRRYGTKFLARDTKD